MNRFHVSGHREFVYTGQPRGLKRLCQTMASLIRSNSFDASGAGVSTQTLLNQLDNIRIQYTPGDHLIVQRPHRSTTDQFEEHAIAGPCTIEFYAPYSSDNLSVCEHIADSLVTNGRARVIVAQPTIEHDFELGSVIRRRKNNQVLFVFTTHNLTDASWINERTLEISVVTPETRRVRGFIDDRLEESEEIGVDEEQC
jgi:hypothetical protein